MLSPRNALTSLALGRIGLSLKPFRRDTLSSDHPWLLGLGLKHIIDESCFMPYQINNPGPKRSTSDVFWRSGVMCRCPRCAETPIFIGVSKVKPECENCGLDLTREDSGDGPSVFITILLGLIFVAAAMWYEFSFEPPIWHHIVLWTPLIIVSNIIVLRPMKSVLIALQYHFAAGERLSDDGSEWQSEDK